jgi:hypothetical protein
MDTLLMLTGIFVGGPLSLKGLLRLALPLDRGR